MLSPEYTNAFERDVKKLKRRKKNTSKLNEVIYLLLNEIALPRKNHNHKLSGNYKDHWECHI
jgi:mRNA interferase YafQ